MPKTPTDQFRILPPHTAAELKALEESILADGLLSPVMIDDVGNVIDGFARRDVCQKHNIDWMRFVDVRCGLSDDDKRALAITVNLARRSTAPTRTQRREYAAILLAANSSQADEAIGSIVGIGRSTVQRIRAELTQAGKLRPALKRLGKDGIARDVSSKKHSAAQKTRLILRNKKEYDRIAPSLNKMAERGLLRGTLVRKPDQLLTRLRRAEALDEVESSKDKPLPQNIELRVSDFRDLQIPAGSVDLLCTDVVWHPDSYQDWVDLAELASRWLKPRGIFASFIGQMSLPLFFDALLKHLNYQWLFKYDFMPYRSASRSIVETWRPIVIFSRAKTINFGFAMDSISKDNGQQKTYHDWQQSLAVTKEIMRRLIPARIKRSFVLDPQVGTGTSAVAAAQLGGRFLGGY